MMHQVELSFSTKKFSDHLEHSINSISRLEECQLNSCLSCVFFYHLEIVLTWYIAFSSPHALHIGTQSILKTTDCYPIFIKRVFNNTCLHSNSVPPRKERHCDEVLYGLSFAFTAHLVDKL